MKHQTVFGALQVGPYGMRDDSKEYPQWNEMVKVVREYLYPWQPIALNWGKKPMVQEGKK